MNLLIFILIYPIIRILSLLPLRVLHLLSNIIYFFLYTIFGYRKKVVRHNLKLSFPNKSPVERLKIEKISMHHFVDTFMEMIKTFGISENQISKRITIENPEEINKFIRENKSIIVISSHYGNWEWAPYLMNQIIECDVYAAYSKIQNQYFERKMKSSRMKFGAKFIVSFKFIDKIAQNVKLNKKAIYGFLSDQSPQLHKAYYWHDFMGIRVPIITGQEMLAKKFDFPVFYLRTDRIKRGYYNSKFILLTEKPKDFADYEITDMFLKQLEKQIRDEPEYYFWTHNRFKHRGKEKKAQN